MSVQVVIQHQSSSLSSVESSNHPTPTRNNNNNNNNNDLINTTTITHCDLSPVAVATALDTNNNNNNNHTEEEEVVVGGERKRRREEEEEEEERGRDNNNNNNNNNNLKLKLVVGLFFTAFRKSVFGCSSSSCDNIIKTTTTTTLFSSSSLSSCGGMEIGVPTNVRHVAHVTFDRFNGFLGLPVEFHPHLPTRPPSASTRVFGVSTNSMQLSFDTRGNSVPTILLLMQHRLYALGGLQAEGVFRINPDNGREEHVRDQLNRGLIPEDVDVHCLAGLIKAWFRELPSGVLDCLTAEQVMESQTEEDCLQLVKLLPPTEADLLDWAVNLMADVAHFQHLNKMNPRNVAMVFAPNMTHMADPLTALMHAVQVMNFLKTLIERRLKEREEASLDTALDSYSRDPSADNNAGCHTPLQTIHEENHESEAADHVGQHYPDDDEQQQQQQLLSNNENINVVIPGGDQNTQSSSFVSNNNNNNNHLREEEESTHQEGSKSIKPKNNCRIISGQSSTTKKGLLKKSNQKPVLQVTKLADKTTNKGSILVTTVKLKNERIEAWR